MASTAAQKKAALALVADSLGVDPDALAALIGQKPAAAAKAKTTPAPAPVVTFTETLDTGVKTAGYDFTSGRTYVSKASIEAQARLANAKKPGFEIVKSERDGARTAAVVVVRDENGKVYVQNLRTV